MRVEEYRRDTEVSSIEDLVHLLIIVFSQVYFQYSVIYAIWFSFYGLPQGLHPSRVIQRFPLKEETV